MLKRGVNTITYKFFKNQVVVFEGTFEVNVADGENRYCNWGSLNYGSYCPSVGQACDDYFYRHNYCR